MGIESFYVDLGNCIREQREAQGITQEYVGALVGVSRASIANVEAGKQRVLAHQLPMLADALGCPVQRLLLPCLR